MSRACLLQLRAEKGKLAVWIPEQEGLWEYRPIGRCSMARLTVYWLDDPKTLLVRGPAGDGLCAIVTVDAEGAVAGFPTVDGKPEIKSVKELGAAHWTFLRPLRADDPAIPGA